MIRDFVWDDYADVVRLWQAVGSGVLTESDLRSALDHGSDLLLLAEVEARVSLASSSARSTDAAGGYIDWRCTRTTAVRDCEGPRRTT